MSAVWLKLLPILCLPCTVLSSPESGGVKWKEFGEAITVQCRHSHPKQEHLALKKGLTEDIHVLVKEFNSETNAIHKAFDGRLQLNGVFPNVDILIKNLTFADTGPYWCYYSRFDVKTSSLITERGNGSVLLVVTDQMKPCNPANDNLALVSVVISAAVLLCIVMVLLIGIVLKTRRVKPKRVNNNDVYEDMRGTLRR